MTTAVYLENRFWSHVNKDGNCWIWVAHTNKGGYGRLRINNKNKLAHRVSYELANGKIAEGLEIDHLCRVRNCVNPSHLEAVSHQENVKRGLSGKTGVNHQIAKTHCPKNHEYNAKNTYWHQRKNGKVSRTCRACNRERMANKKDGD